MAQPQSPGSLLNALLEYEVHLRTTLPPQKANAIWAQVRTALLRYTLPGWGFSSPQGQRLSPAEYEQGLQLLKQLPIDRVQEAPETQERLFEQWAVAGNTRRNYRWALRLFIDWCQQQGYVAEDRPVSVHRPQPRKRQRKTSADEVRLTTRRARPPYRLTEANQSALLQQELDLFLRYLTEPRRAGADTGVSVATATQYVDQVLRILGWLHTEQGVPSQQLHLHQLLAGGDAGGKAPEAVIFDVDAERLTGLVTVYLDWLKAPVTEQSDGRSEAVQSPYTDRQVIQAWLRAVQFLIHQAQPLNQSQLAKAEGAMAALKEMRRQASARLKHHQPVSSPSKKQLEWHEFHELVEQLRGECVPRFAKSTQSQRGGSTLATPRSLTAIAHSYQRFLLAALLSYIPPQPPRALRNLLITQFPLEAQSLQLPDLSQEASLLYRDQEGWQIHVLKQQKENTLIRYHVSLPNLTYPDGRCFYQYLEEWLHRYVYRGTHGQEIEVPGLRSCFKPQHHRLFTMKNGHPYETAPAFIKLLRHPAYRTFEKALDFRSVRGMYARHLESLKSKDGLGEPSNGSNSLSDKIHNLAQDSVLAEADYAYDLADSLKASEIAQEFLNQMV